MLCHYTHIIEIAKIMAFTWMEPIRSKILISDRSLEQINTFKYLWYSISPRREKDL